MPAPEAVSSGRTRSSRSLHIDAARIVGAALIFLYHFGGDYPRVFGPTAMAALFVPLVRHFAAWGIALFIVISGFSLTAALAVRRYHYGTWASRRVQRLLIPLWLVAVPYLCAALIVHEFTLADSWKLPVWLSGLGVLSPATYLPPSQDWWFVSLALQLALLAPALWYVLDKTGPVVTAAACSLVTVAWLGWVLRLPAQWHYLNQGAAPARLVEFALGMVAAWYATRQPTRRDALALVGSAALLVGSGYLAQQLGGLAPTVAIATIALLLVTSCVAGGLKSHTPFAVALVAEATYVFYLTHAPVSRVTLEVANRFGVQNPPLLMVVCLGAASVVAALFVRLDHVVVGRFGFGSTVGSK